MKTNKNQVNQDQVIEATNDQVIENTNIENQGIETTNIEQATPGPNFETYENGQRSTLYFDPAYAIKAPPDLVTPGKKGVTNAQMIPAIRNYLADNNTDSLQALKVNFPGIYLSSVKYLSKDQKAKLEALAIA